MNAPILLTLNLEDESLLLNEGTLDALDWPQQVQVMINEKEKMLLLRACTIDDMQAIVMPEKHTEQFEISARSLLKKIRREAGWKDSRPRLCYGEYLPAHQAVRFSLAEAEPLETISDMQQ